MTDRDRLIELLENTAHEKGGMPNFSEIADYLIAKGVIVPPLPIGSTVYEIRAKGEITKFNRKRKRDYAIVNNLYLKNAIALGLSLYVKEKKYVKYDKSRLNNTVFKSKEKAEIFIKAVNKNGG